MWCCVFSRLAFGRGGASISHLRLGRGVACLSPQLVRAEGSYEQLQIQAPEAVDMIMKKLLGGAGASEETRARPAAS